MRPSTTSTRRSSLGRPRNSENWDSGINVGTDDSDDLLRVQLAFDFHHPIVETFSAADYGFTDLSDKLELPASTSSAPTLLKETGPWRDTGVMDGSLDVAPVDKLKPLLDKAHSRASTSTSLGASTTRTTASTTCT